MRKTESTIISFALLISLAIPGCNRSKYPADEISNYNKAQELISSGQWEDGIKYCNRALEINSNNANTYNLKGVALLALNRNDEAIISLNKALSIEPANTGAMENMINALAALKRYKEAELWINKALLIDKNNFSIWNDAGNINAELGKRPLALKCYNKALKIDSSKEYVSANKMNLLFTVIKDNNKEEISSILGSSPDNIYDWLDRGMIMTEAKRYSEAISCFDKALELDNKNPVAWYSKGYATMMSNTTIVLLPFTKEHKETVAAFNNAIEYAPSQDKNYVKEAKKYLDIITKE
jgi:tetratricopeptide (TPR) repeat protein